jgi:carbamoyl-phosphate synthase large subunit
MSAAEAWAEPIAGRRVLVTGGAGVIAGELLARLSAAGAETLSADRLPLEAPPRGVHHLTGDLAVIDLAPISAFRPEIVFHLAATFERSVETPEFWAENWNDNVVVSHRLTELAAETGGVETFVFASSYLVYDPSQYLRSEPGGAPTPLAEGSRLRPRNLCGAAKLYAEGEIEFAREVQSQGFRAVNARIYRVYGRGSKDVVSRWVRAALRDEPIDVYHPENRFDYVFSGDVAEGLLRMAASPHAEGAMNLAAGRSRSIHEVIAAIEAATGRPLRATTHAVDEPFEASQADLGRLRDALGWSPGTALEDGVGLLVEFERERVAATAGA